MKTPTLLLASTLALTIGCDESASSSYEIPPDRQDLSDAGTHDPGHDAALYSADSSVGEYEEPVLEEGDEDAQSPERPEPNPFVAAAHDPFSTFGADVDTASYQYALKLLKQGVWPNPNEVRLEDFVNYFEYQYAAPQPGAEVPFAIHLDASVHPLGRTTELVRVGIQAETPPDFEKKPTNLVFLIDTSGSMQASDKLPLIKTVLRETLTVLAPDDTVSIVTYASGVGVALSPTPASNTEAILDVTENLTAAGSTNGAGGLQLAYEQAASAFIAGGINHVVLCTDGDFNVGISGTDQLVDFIEEKRDTGVTLTALGFGTGNLNDEMMELVSNAGNGVYGYIADQDAAVDYTHDRMLSTLVHVAKDLKIQVEFNSDKVLGYRLLGYENRGIADNDFRNDEVDAGEVGAGHRVTALYEVVLVGSDFPEGEGLPDVQDGEPVEGDRSHFEGELLTVRVRWKGLDEDSDAPAHETEASLDELAVASNSLEASNDLRWAAAVAGLAERLMHSPFAREGEIALIKNIVAAQAARDADRAELNAVLSNLPPE